VAQNLATIANFVGCGAKNCTEDQFGGLQWGQSKFTTAVASDRYKDSKYLPLSKTAYDWNLTLPRPPEWTLYKGLAGYKDDLQLSTVTATTNKGTGLTNVAKAQTFITYIEKNNKTMIDAYAKQFSLKDGDTVKQFYLVLRWMVQEYLMGGMRSSGDLATWLSPSEYDPMYIMGQGDFYEGQNDMDLDANMSPLQAQQTSSIRQSSTSISTGSRDVNNVARIMQYNGLSYINKVQDIYDGAGYNTLNLNPWSQVVPFGKATNGLQFMPEFTEDRLHYFERNFFRNIAYKPDSDTKYGGVDVKRFVEADNYAVNAVYNQDVANTMNIGTAFNLDLLLGKPKCQGCDDKLTETVKVDGKPFNQMKGGAETVDFMDMQIGSGVMAQIQRKGTVFFRIKDNALPFPGLSKEILIPFYDLEESIKMDEGVYASRYSYITANSKSIQNVYIALGVLSGIFLLLGIGLAVLYCRSYKGGVGPQ